MEIVSEKKQKHLPKGFLSTNEKPTINSVVMFFIYLSNLPEGWGNSEKVYLPAVEVVRRHFGVDYGFENMIRWGIQHGCCKSKTSSGRHNSMSQSYTLAKSLMGAGVTLGNFPVIYLSKVA
jgi:hypothetical protein